jgi:hypothetical protein
MRASASGLRLGKRAGAAILTGLLLWAPPPANADDDDWGDGHRHGGRHWRHDDDDHWHHRGRRHEHGDWCPPRHAPGPRYYPRPYASWGWYGPPPVAHARYRCEPCGRWYDDEAEFNYHVHHHHHIAEAVIPLVIGAAAFGWIFYGN